MGMGETEEFWRGSFGDEYVARNANDKLLKSKEWMLRKALAPMFHAKPQRVIEFGANVGLNLRALARIEAFSTCEFAAVEINHLACETLRGYHGLHVHEVSMLDKARPWGKKYDLSMAVGVLIHQDPADLPAAYAALHDSSRRFIFMAEYHSVEPREISYRGHSGKLWARDFCSEFMAAYPDLIRVDYGYIDRHDTNPQDSINWYIFVREPSSRLRGSASAEAAVEID